MAKNIQAWLLVVAPGLSALALCRSHPAPGPLESPAQEVRVKLRAADFEEAGAVPFAAEHEIEAALPVALVGDGFAVRKGVKRLEIDVRGAGNYSKKISERKPALLELQTEGGERKVLVYARSGRWYAASGASLVGKALGQPIMLLDGDLDGEFLGPSDYVRIGTGCPMACDERQQIMVGETMYSMALDASARRVELALTPMPRPEGSTREQWRALAAINGFRRAVGLPPVSLSLDRSAACQLHAEYLYLNGYDYTKPWDGVGSHDAIAGNPGYTLRGPRSGPAERNGQLRGCGGAGERHVENDAPQDRPPWGAGRGGRHRCGHED